MPLYEYECKKCHHRFERIVKFSDPPMKKCPDCGGQVEQLISAPTVQFKGSGWYVTDYAKKSGAAAPSNGDSSAKSDSSSDSSSKDDSSKESSKESASSSKGDSKDSGSKKESKSKSEGSEKKKSSSSSSSSSGAKK
jgi:putative FmdB family regulatory protein